MVELVDVMVQTMGAAYPELPARADFIRQVVREEEGTFLRRNLLLAFGAVDVVAATTMLRFERGFQVAGASIKALSFFSLVEGGVFLYDALLRPRPLKPSSKVSKGQ